MSNVVYQPSQTTHWRNMFENKSSLLGSHNLNPGEELIVQIQSVEIGSIKGKKGKQESVPVATFYNAPPMVLNVTNCQTLETLFGPYRHDWVNKYIQVFAVKVNAFGKEQLALRIRPFIPSTGEDVSGHESKLRSCKNLKELQSVYMALPKHLKTSLNALKDEMKGKLNA